MTNVQLTIRFEKVKFDQCIADSHRKLLEWREGCYKTIEETYQRKLKEINEYVKKMNEIFEEKKTRIEKNISQLNNDQYQTNKENIDLNSSLADSIVQDLKDIGEMSIEVSTRPLSINDNYVHIEKRFNLERILPKALQFLYLPKSSSALANNRQWLLMHQYPYLCLIDRDLKIVKQCQWFRAWIRDMCWSETLNCFIILTDNDIYVVNESLEMYSCWTNDNKILWFSCTCSSRSLYLSTNEWGSSIFELELSPSLKLNNLLNRWKPPITCQHHDGINDIKYNNEKLALMIKDTAKDERRMDLKSAKTFDTIWSLKLSVGPDIRLFTCCPISWDEWLVIDGTNSRIYHITKDGVFLKDVLYHSVPYRANLFSSNILAVSAEWNLNLHRIF